MSILQVPGRHLPSLKHCCEIPERAALFRGFDSVHDRQMHLRGYSKECVYIYIYHLFLAWSFMSRVFLFFCLLWSESVDEFVNSLSFPVVLNSQRENSKWTQDESRGNLQPAYLPDVSCPTLISCFCFLPVWLQLSVDSLQQVWRQKSV